MSILSTIRNAGAAVSTLALATAVKAQAAGGAYDVDPQEVVGKLEEVGGTVVAVFVGLGLFALGVWGASRIYSIFSGKGR